MGASSSNNNNRGCSFSVTSEEEKLGAAIGAALHKGNLESKLIDPTLPLRFDFTKEDITRMVDELIARQKLVEDGVAAATENTWAARIAPLATDHLLRMPQGAFLDLMSRVLENKELRDHCSDEQKRLSAFSVAASMRVDVFTAVKAFSETSEYHSLLADGQPKRFVDRLLRDYRRSGLDLAATERGRMQSLQTELTALCLAFSKNVDDDTTKGEFTREQLDGMTDDEVNRYKKSAEGKFLVTLQYPDYFPLMKTCKVEETRRTMQLLFDSRCRTVNEPLLSTIAKLRAEQARLLGKPSHAHHILDIRMAKTPLVALEFLDILSTGLAPLVEKELAALVALKKADCDEDKKAFDGKINAWDFRYYLNKCEEVHYKINHSLINEYFPLQKVTAGLFEIYQGLLGVIFVQHQSPHVWHPEVQLYSVFDRATSTLIGYFYLDLHPRPGKFTHAAVFGVSVAVATAKGEVLSTPSAAMVANFTRPSADKPALLKHDEVVTYFHEFGHVMHQLLGQTQFAIFAGTRVERDFVEAPSQMLENWCWEAPSLALLSGHYITSEPLPKELLDKLVASKNANIGVLTKRQIVFAMFDQRLHALNYSPDLTVDTQLLAHEVQTKVGPIDPIPGGNFSASFAHLTGGYDATYYGYLYTKAFSDDMFDTRFKGRVLDPEVGAAYRRSILAPGGSLDAERLLHNFLGRMARPDAFFERLGIQGYKKESDRLCF